MLRIFLNNWFIGRTEVKHFPSTDFDQNWYETSVNVTMCDIHWTQCLKACIIDKTKYIFGWPVRVQLTVNVTYILTICTSYFIGTQVLNQRYFTATYVTSVQFIIILLVIMNYLTHSARYFQWRYFTGHSLQICSALCSS